MEAVTDFIFLVSKVTVDHDCSHEIKRHSPLEGSCDKPRWHIKSSNINLLTKDQIVKTMFFPSIPVWMLQLDHKED